MSVDVEAFVIPVGILLPGVLCLAEGGSKGRSEDDIGTELERFSIALVWNDQVSAVISIYRLKNATELTHESVTFSTSLKPLWFTFT